MNTRKALLILMVVGCATFFISTAPWCVSDAQAYWIPMPDGTWVHVGHAIRPGGMPSVSRFNPYTGRIDRSIDAGLTQMGLPPITIPNGTGGTTIYRSARPRTGR
jgi:hypothetical protein